MYPVFKQAIDTILLQWNVVKFSVDQQTGGKQSKEIAEWMTGVIEQYFYNNDSVDEEEIAEYISEIMDAELNTQVDDGSDVLVGKDLCRMYRLCQNGESAQAQQELESRPQISNPNPRIICEDETEESEEPELVNTCMSHLQLDEPSSSFTQNELTEADQQNLPTEDDGWTVIKKNGNKRY